MTDDDSTSAPMDLYKDFIDELVERSESPAAVWLTQEGFYSRARDDRDLDDFAKSLSESQRALLARICSKERLSGIFDVLAALTWLVDCEDLELLVSGKRMPVALHGMGLHGDYVDRLQGGSWPTE